jgi:hypothetical protein
MKTFTKAQIKKAFFKQFRGAGELWFPYNYPYTHDVGDKDFTDEDLDHPVQQEFDEFMKKLKEVS